MFNDKFKKMLDKKSGKEMSDNERDAKMSVIQHLKNHAEDAMKNHMDELHKVSVASNSGDGLKDGLEKAKEILGAKEHEGMVEDAENPLHDIESAEDNQPEGSDEEESEESPEDEAKEGDDDDESEESINQKLEALMEKKKKLDAKKKI